MYIYKKIREAKNLEILIISVLLLILMDMLIINLLKKKFMKIIVGLILVGYFHLNGLKVI